MSAKPKLASNNSRRAALEPWTFFWSPPYPSLQSAAPMATGPPGHIPLGPQTLFMVTNSQSTQKGLYQSTNLAKELSSSKPFLGFQYPREKILISFRLSQALPLL